MDGLHERGYAHVLEEQVPLGTAVSTGTLGAAGGATSKVSGDDQGDTSAVLLESRAWTRQYQLPRGRFGDQVVLLVHPDE